MFDSFKYIIIGSGLSGATLAERIANVLNEPVLVLEKRGHTGGNSYSAIDADSGIECHYYGSHIFHTRHRQVWDYVRQFSRFNSYRHRVFTEYSGKVYPLPISLDTINRFYGRNFKPSEALDFIQDKIRAANIPSPRNLEEKAISLIGKSLYEAFIKGYTWKQWNRNPQNLPPEIITRLPVRLNYNSEYFSDPWQGIPLCGYGALVKKMLDHPLISVRLNTDANASMLADFRGKIFHSGQIDRHFAFEFGKLAFRSLRFEYEIVPIRDYQGISVMNYADKDIPWTRIHEFKHYHPEREEVFLSQKSLICREYPEDFRQDNEPYYPINDAPNHKLYKRYENLARKKGIRFFGRLGSYVYADMDEAIHKALQIFEKEILPDHNVKKDRV